MKNHSLVISLCLCIAIVSSQCSLPGQAVPITIHVITPSSTPSDGKIFIAGNSTLLGDWSPGEVPLDRLDDSTWVFRFRVPIGARVEFKITRGSWETQALYATGEIPDNIRFIALQETLVVVRPVSWKDLEFKPGEGITGTIRRHPEMKGEGLRYQRDVSVWLPPSYEKEPARRYPVLYMHDGQNVFDPSTSFTGYDWHVDEVSDSLIRYGAMEEIIVVALNNTPDRTSEYSDTKLGRAYAGFVVNTVKPLIDSTYRTKSGPDNTAVMGSSMGGLISFLFVWWYPQVFSKAGCLSSAFDSDGGRLLDEVRQHSGPKKAIRIYFDCGTEELDARLKPGSDSMARILAERGYQEGRDWIYVVDEGGLHNERAWAARVWKPLQFMFGI